MRLFLRQVVGITLLAFATASYAADAAMNEAARAALRDGDYARVVQLTTEIAKTEPGASLNWYRMAIAAARSGDPRLAADALERAERADPTLRFASSPERVERLRADIRNALEAADAPGPGPGEVAQGDLMLAQDVDPGAIAAVEALSQQLHGWQDSMDKRLDVISRELATVQGSQVAAAKAANWERAVWIVGFLVLIVVAAALIALFMERAARARRRFEMKKVASMPLPDLIEVTRDANAILIQRLERHGHRETDLFVQLTRAQPALERESGRARVSVDELTAGRALADASRPLVPKSKVLGHSDPGELHRSVVERALRTPGPPPDRLVA